MNKTEAMKRLEAAGSAQTRKIYSNHGVQAEMFGVKFGDLGKLRREIGTDQKLAEGLWATKNHDARVLATMVADPEAMTVAKLEAWAKTLADHVITSSLTDLIRSGPHHEKLAKKWSKSTNEYVGTAGWFLIARLAENEDLGDDFFVPYLETIEAKIHKAKNRTRYGMNTALIGIGCRKGLMKQAIAMAKRIGPVEVDHGNTSCQTPDAASYIAKTVKHRKEVAARRAAKKKTAKKTTKKAARKTARKTSGRATKKKTTARR